MDKASYRGSGVTKAAYYKRKKEWTMTLYDKDGNEYIVNPKMVMQTNSVK